MIFAFGLASGSSDRLFTPAAALFGVSLNRSVAPFGLPFAMGLETAAVAGLGACCLSPRDDSKELNDCVRESAFRIPTPRALPKHTVMVVATLSPSGS
jgi:hypothetical protein